MQYGKILKIVLTESVKPRNYLLAVKIEVPGKGWTMFRLPFRHSDARADIELPIILQTLADTISWLLKNKPPGEGNICQDETDSEKE